MFRTVTAEFESIESAEKAARSIKEYVTDIQKMSIKTEKKTDDTRNFYFNNMNCYTIAGSFIPYDSTYCVPALFSSINSSQISNQHFQLKKSTLEVTCKHEQINTVHNIITNNHGLGIKEK